MMDKVNPINVLVVAFPRLFHGNPPSVPSGLPLGWQKLVHAMFVDIDSLLTDVEAETFRVLQIKQKFGGLRVYFQREEESTLTGDFHTGGVRRALRIDINPSPSSRIFQLIRARVDQAEEESFVTCERCGVGNASMRNLGGWWTTQCDECQAALLKSWRQAYDEKLR